MPSCYLGVAIKAMNNRTNDGLSWLLDSGVHDSYDAECGFDCVSVHATSRFIQAMLKLGKPDAPRRLEAATRAGRFLLEHAFDLTTDLFVADFPEESAGVGPRKASLTGCAAALQALVDLWQATGDGVYRECAARCARSLQTRMSRVDGAYFLSYDVDHQSPDFGLDAEADQIKLAAAFWRLAEDAGLREFDSPAQHMVQWALTRHESLLPEWVEHEDLVPRIERYALFLEGLLPVAHLDPQASHAFQGGVIKLEKGVQEANGSSSPQALARLLRLRLYADSFGIIELDRREAEREQRELEERQIRSANRQLDGAFVLPGFEQDFAHAGVESTIVSTQALTMWDEVADGGFRDPWQKLI